MVQYDKILVEFFQSKFGNILGDSLLDIYIQRTGIVSRDNLRNLTIDKQQEFVRYVLDSIFKSFYDSNKIFQINLLCLFRYALGNASEKTQDMTNMKTSIADFEFNKVSSITFVKAYLDDEHAVYTPYVFSGDVDALVIIKHDKKVAESLGRTIVQRMMGMDSFQDIDQDTIIGGLSEFYNILLPSFSDIISNAFSAGFSFIPVEKTEMENKISDLTDDDILTVSKATLNIKLEGADNPVECIVIMRQATDVLLDLIKSSAKESNGTEASQILVKKTGVLDADLNELFVVVFKPEFKKLSSIEIRRAANVQFTGHDVLINIDRFLNYIFKENYVDTKHYSKDLVRRNVEYLCNYVGSELL